MTYLRIVIPLYPLFKHDLFDKRFVREDAIRNASVIMH